MEFVSRNDQVRREHQSFWPLSVKSQAVGWSEDLFDGVALTPKYLPANWIDENVVHKAIEIGANIDTTRCFTSTQVIAVRDDIRFLTHIAVANVNALDVCTVKDATVVSRKRLLDGWTRRVHICLEKFTGDTYVLHVPRMDSGHTLFLNSSELSCEASDIDFPFMGFSQAGIGHVPRDKASFGLITYKGRDTGRIYIRRWENDEVSDERTLTDIPSLGGCDFAFNEDEVLLRIDSLQDDRIVPLIAKSNDQGRTFSDFEEADLSSVPNHQVLPSSTAVISDYLGRFHIPVRCKIGEEHHLISITPYNRIVDAMSLRYGGAGPVMARFPSKPGLKPGPEGYLGIGDGEIDGAGIIVTGVSAGRLYVSNSQCGGYTYPDSRLLNFDMPYVFCFKPSECCYTRAVSPNLVTMDYLFVECNDEGDPINNTMLLETWDMPLPEPIVEANSQDGMVNISISKSAWFDRGKSTFGFSDPRIEIKNVVFKDDRNVVLEVEGNARGTTLTFDTRSTFYWHRGSCKVS